jgi:hypothetical protein
MVNTLWSWISDSREKMRKTAEVLWVWETFEREMRQPLWASDVLAQETQAQADATRIAELNVQIKNYDWDLWKIAKVWVGMSVVPDSIDEIWPRHEYTKEDAQAYLDELNRRYPIQEVLGEYYGNFLRGESKHVFDMSFVWDTTLEDRFYEMFQQSVKAWKWVSSLTPRWSMEYIKNHPEWDKKLESILKFDALGFFDAYPEAHQFLEDYEQTTLHPLKLIPRTKKLIEMFFQMNKIVKNMDDWSKGVFLNKVWKIKDRETDYAFELQTWVFPKEHFIQWLMKRLGTSGSSLKE